MSDLGIVSHYLRMEIRHDWENRTLILLQTSYLKVILECFDMAECKSISPPMDSGLSNIIMPSFQDFRALAESLLWYLSVLGSLINATTITQPDIVFQLSIVSKYYNNLDSTHVTTVTRILCYIKTIFHKGIIFCGDLGLEIKLDLIGFSDTNYGSLKKDRKSTSDLLFSLSRGLINWNSKKQSVIMLSSCEAKYIALNEANKKVFWL